MTSKFIERCLQINRNSKNKQDGIVIMKLLIAILENLQGRVDDALPFIIQTCMTELQDKNPKNVKSMILQTLAMCLWYNPQLAFQIFESS